MQKAKLKLIKPLIVILVLLLCFIIFFGKPIFYRLYLGYRIKGDITVTVDNGDYAIKETQISGTDKTKIKDNEAKVAVKAGEYGEYCIYLDLSDIYSDAKPIEISCFQSNWWNVTEFKLNIEIDTKQNSISYSGDYTTIADSGKKCFDKIEMQQSIDEEYLGISFGL